ncbi:hypothetical protein [Salipaludibacillus aurantiacus]|uniref:Uncharacterized protein n=1 Tax=Salipaludibacillus aurantiacus TaxID=1601833 RepID=A0A1H9X386_9BACI|nr:hypothetical protein [Salipaludibacillus aurantiacus]SES40347.1 hypothetical protein SAMN05518684_12347 [Salipaludibacillus aurantiacus]
MSDRTPKRTGKGRNGKSGSKLLQYVISLIIIVIFTGFIIGYLTVRLN